MTPTQLFRAALAHWRTGQTFTKLDRCERIDERRAMQMLRRNVRDADTDKACDDRCRFIATGMLWKWYCDDRAAMVCDSHNLTE